MPKLRKQRKRKVYRFDVNRKRLKKKMNRLPNIQCEQLKKVWDRKKSTRQNLVAMGLVHDPNQNIKIPSSKAKPKSNATEAPVAPVSSKVVEELEAEAKAPRERNFRLPKSHVSWLCKLIDKYGEDYEAMARDRKLNCFQDTWKQLKSKINVFKNIPEQYGEYLKRKEEEAKEKA